MAGRDAQVDAFLAAAGWRSAERQALAGDLSARRYLRLRLPGGESAVLMDAPPERDPSTPAFVRMTAWLREAGLSAPEILSSDPPAGLLLLEDFGDHKVSAIPADAAQRDAIYGAALDLLLLLRSRRPPDLAAPDARQFVAMTTLADEWYPGLDKRALRPFRSVLETVFDDILRDPPTVSLRDFHADNLIWLPGRSGLARLGLLDYQDAFLTHPVYDLVSLLTDARTDIDPQFRQRHFSAYLDRSGDDRDRWSLAFAAFAAQRNLRILGIFARAARAFGKPAHLDKQRRVHGYFAEALAHPVFDGVRTAALRAVPAPSPSTVAGAR